MSLGVAPLGELFRPYQMPRDELTKEVARLLSTPTEVHAMFASNVYLGEGGVTGENRIKELIAAMPVCLEADAAASAAKKAKRAPTEAEATLIARADTLREKLVQVTLTLALALALALTLALALALAAAPIPTPTPVSYTHLTLPTI